MGGEGAKKSPKVSEHRGKQAKEARLTAVAVVAEVVAEAAINPAVRAIARCDGIHL